MLDGFSIDLSFVIPALGGVLAGLALGMAVAFVWRRDLRQACARLQDELSRTEVQTREQARQTTRMRSEQRTFANFLRQLPGAVQELNRDQLDPRRIPTLILDLAAAIFEPEQMALYLVRQNRETDETARLHLVAQRGLPAFAQKHDPIRLGEGRIGWVAQHQVEMTPEDWNNPGRTDGGVPPATSTPGVRADLSGPLIHHGRTGPQSLGVLSLGNPAVRPRDEKLMLQMVTNLAGIALTHSRNLNELQSLANHDGLTLLMNKRHFMDRLGVMINAAEREIPPTPLAVFIFDIDHFKRYNDTNGHLCGDELLKEIATLVREGVRPGDVACRYGGEEFIIAMPDTDAADALRLAERIRATIEAYDFPHRASQPGGQLTISGGVAAYPHDGTNSTELISHADQALYRAKGRSRNLVLRYEGVTIGSSDPTDVSNAIDALFDGNTDPAPPALDDPTAVDR